MASQSRYLSTLHFCITEIIIGVFVIRLMAMKFLYYENIVSALQKQGKLGVWRVWKESSAAASDVPRSAIKCASKSACAYHPRSMTRCGPTPKMALAKSSTKFFANITASPTRAVLEVNFSKDRTNKAGGVSNLCWLGDIPVSLTARDPVYILSKPLKCAPEGISWFRSGRWRCRN